MLSRWMILFLLFLATPAATQQLRVVHAYEGMRSYALAAQNEQTPDLAALFRAEVVDPHWQECGEGARYEAMAARAVDTAISDLQGLLKAVDVLRSSDMESRVAQGLESAVGLLPGGRTTVCVLAADPGDLFIRDVMNGVSAFAPGAGRIWLVIHTDGAWQQEIGPALAHEYHHSVSLEFDRDDEQAIDLLETIVLEGRADSFARLLYPEKSYPWIEALPPEEENALWERMRPQLGSTDEATHDAFLFGGPGLPRWGGYTIGYHIVQSYLERHPEADVVGWLRLPARELLEQSGYRGVR